MHSKLVMSVAGIGDDTLNVDREINMLKTALLYADHVDLYSMKGSILNSVNEIQKTRGENPEKFLEELAKYKNLMNDDQDNTLEYIRKFYRLERKNRKTKEELLTYINIKKDMNSAIELCYQEVDKMLLETGYGKFERAIQNGVMNLKELGSIHNYSDESKLDDFVNNYFNILAEVIEKGESYPYFDEEVMEYFSDLKRKKIIKTSEAQTRVISHAQLVGDLFSRLPDVTNMNIEEILFLREELKAPLIRFRSEVDKLSEQVHSEVWSKDFTIECSELFYNQIAPTVLDIEESIQENSLVKKTLSNVVNSETLKVAGGGSLLGFGISHASELVSFPPELIGVTAGATKAVIDSYIQWKEEKKNIAKNNLYFYYRVSSRKPK